MKQLKEDMTSLGGFIVAASVTQELKDKDGKQVGMATFIETPEGVAAIDTIQQILRDSNRLRLYKGAKLVKTFGVATGQDSFPTPIGSFEIVLQRTLKSVATGRAKVVPAADLRCTDPYCVIRSAVIVPIVVGVFVFGAFFATIFQASLFMQEVLGYSAIRTGVAYLAIAATAFVVAGAGAAVGMARSPGGTSVGAKGTVSCSMSGVISGIGSGRCTRMPSQDRISPSARVRAALSTPAENSARPGRCSTPGSSSR